MEDSNATSRVEDRRVAARGLPGAEERRVADRDRRIAPRMRTLKGAKMVVTGGPSIACIVRNISETGARIQVSEPILHNVFELVFDDEEWPPRGCRVVWRRNDGIGVTFDRASTVEGG